MLWQKASATTRATASPVSSRAQDSSVSVRTVVAPSRRRQNDAKSRSPTSEAAATFIASRSRGRGRASTCDRTSGSTSAGSSATR